MLLELTWADSKPETINQPYKKWSEKKKDAKDHMNMAFRNEIALPLNLGVLVHMREQHSILPL